MSVFRNLTSAAEAVAAKYSTIVQIIGGTVRRGWADAYPLIRLPDAETDSIDIEASQAFFDGAGTDGLTMLIGHATVSNAANLVHLLSSGAEQPPAVAAAGQAFFHAALAFREACREAGILDGLPILVDPPVILTPSSDGSITVTAKA